MSALMNNNQNREQNIPDVGKLCPNNEMDIVCASWGKEKSPELRAFLGSGDLTRTDDTPGMKQKQPLFKKSQNKGGKSKKTAEFRE